MELSRRGDIEVGYCARPNEVDFRLIAPRAVLEEVEPHVLAAIGTHLVSVDGDNIEEVVVSRLTHVQKTLAVAESCTGGLLANRITNVPGASLVFLEGFVTYSNEAKMRSDQRARETPRLARSRQRSGGPRDGRRSSGENRRRFRRWASPALPAQRAGPSRSRSAPSSSRWPNEALPPNAVGSYFPPIGKPSSSWLRRRLSTC